jgi:hypothetical protein
MNIQARHSIAMAKGNSSHTELWLVNADHGGAVGAAPQQFEAKVVGYCAAMHN